MRFQRGKIRKIGNAGQSNNRNIQRFLGFVVRKTLTDRILVVKVYVRIRNDAPYRFLHTLFQHLKAGAKNLLIAAKLVNHQSADSFLLMRFQ